jgi:DNA mismatch repair protein MutS2
MKDAGSGQNVTTPSFLDSKTVQSVAWDVYWNRIQPVHELGREYKQSVGPFLPGEEQAYETQVRWLDRVIRHVFREPGWMTACVTTLQKLPVVKSLLNGLKHQAILGLADWFIWKQWLIHARQLRELTAPISSSDALVHLDRFDWDGWLHLLNPQGDMTSTFALRDLQDPVWNRLEQRRVELERTLLQLKLKQSKRIREMTGLQPDRNRQVIVRKGSVPSSDPLGFSDLIAVCKKCNDLRYWMETEEEVVFQVVDDPEMEAVLTENRTLQFELEACQRELLTNLSCQFWKHVQEIERAAGEVGKLDYFLAVARLVQKEETWCWGELSCRALQIQSGWHPVYREYHDAKNPGRPWTPVTLNLGKVNVLTGPNMGGKSVTLKTIGLIQILFQHGLPLPAERVTGIFCPWVRFHGGDDSDEALGLSSFGAELIRLADVLRLQGKGLLLLDEVARSTNPEEGEALAVSIVETAWQREAITVCASHFSKVGNIPHITRFQVKGLRDLPQLLQQFPSDSLPSNELLRLLQQHMDYTIVPVDHGEVPHYALMIARILGVPEPIVERSFALLKHEPVRVETDPI